MNFRSGSDLKSGEYGGCEILFGVGTITGTPPAMGPYPTRPPPAFHLAYLAHSAQLNAIVSF